MKLPADSTRSRLYWSIAAAVIIAIWAYGVLAAGATIFPDQYTPSQTLQAIAENFELAVWPGEFGGSHGHSWSITIWNASVQASPLIAACVWALCLVPWERKWMRVCSLFLALLAPSSFLTVNPFLIVIGPLIGLPSVVLGSDGEGYQDGLVLGAAIGLWWWMLVPVLIATMRRPVVVAGCSKCGYSTEGLLSDVCPECGWKRGASLRSGGA